MEGKAVKIIDVDEKGEHFVLNEKALFNVFSQVPEDLPVCIIGVVGAFRTGKSFLLDFFLRYLKNTSGKKLDNDFSVEDMKLSWMKDGVLEGGKGDSDAGFKWKAGEDRCTTGIWIWNEYFVRKNPETKEPMAVFLMDTQGMYDHETSQHLTASIFGLSALLTSYTVYNLVFQIQEDHLQHLALFSEYGRVALKEANDRGLESHPFQKLEFLVRDFTHFKDTSKSLNDLQQEMSDYLEKVFQTKLQRDLKEVRDQIDLCYEEISCYCLPHPGHEVSEQDGEFNETGEVGLLRPKFKRILGDYVRRVFNERLCVKNIQGQQMSAMRLYEFVKVYTKLFQESNIFPEAMTLFRATQEANIAFATNKALSVYKTEMDEFAGIGKVHRSEEELLKAHKKSKREALREYDDNTKIGSEEVNKESKKDLHLKIKERFEEYKESNRLRDPMAFLAPYLIPIAIGVVAYLLRMILEAVCPRRSYTCLDFADFFGSVYTVIFAFLLFHVLTSVYGIRNQLGGLFSMATTKLKKD